MSTPAAFDVPARLRAGKTDEAVHVREIVLDSAPPVLHGQSVAVTVGRRQPVTFEGVLWTHPDGSATVRSKAAGRAAYRIAVALDVLVARSGARHNMHAVTRDLSLAGTLLSAAAHDLGVGEQVDLRITLPDGADVLVSGTVVRSPGSAQAVRFDEFAPRSERALQLYLADVQRQQLAMR